jgi:exosortase E/protease (VPEID-CTERM system)
MSPFGSIWRKNRPAVRAGHATLWSRVAAATFRCVEQLLGLVYSPIVSVPSEQILGTSTFQVTISPECSGYEGIALICLFLSLYLWLFRRALRFPHALLLLPVGVLAIWLCNIVRITRLIAIGTSISPGVALGGFHSQAGWLFFLSVSLGLMAAGHSLRLFAAQPLPQSEATSPRGAPDAAALLVPALVLLASIILISAASSGFDRWYPLRLVATAAALWHFYRRGQIGDAVYAHMTTNALIAAYVLCVGRWSLWA